MKRKTCYRIGQVLYSILGIFSVLVYFFKKDELNLIVLSLISLAIVYLLEIREKIDKINDRDNRNE